MISLFFGSCLCATRERHWVLPEVVFALGDAPISKWTSAVSKEKSSRVARFTRIQQRELFSALLELARLD
jgi:hypothetical protein